MKPSKPCELCAKNQGSLEFHHLIPKQLHSKGKFLRKYSKEYMRTHGINICRYCHKQLHWMYDHHFLGENLNTKEAILQDSKFQKYLNWSKKQKRYIV